MDGENAAQSLRIPLAEQTSLSLRPDLVDEILHVLHEKIWLLLQAVYQHSLSCGLRSSSMDHPTYHSSKVTALRVTSIPHQVTCGGNPAFRNGCQLLWMPGVPERLLDMILRIFVEESRVLAEEEAIGVDGPGEGLSEPVEGDAVKNFVDRR